MTVRSGRVADVLLFATVFTITFGKVRWAVGGLDVNISDITASLFVVVFAWTRVVRRDWRLPRTEIALALFFAAFVAVYLVAYFNLETSADRDLFVKGMAKFAVHFAFLLTAVAHLARRSARFYWQTLGWFVGGIAVNAAYGLLELAYAETTGAELDQVVLEPFTGEVTGGIGFFGAVSGAAVYRVNALTLDPNHLAIMLIVPLLILLPLYVRLERGSPLRVPLAALVGFLFVVELATLSRSGLAGLAVGLLVLAVPYRRFILTPRFLVPLGAVALVLAVIVAQRTAFWETVFNARTSFSGGGTRVHLDFYELLPPALETNPLFGRGLNTFSAYFEFLTGRANWGPHSYYVAILIETGLVGTAVFLAFLVYVFQRLGALRRLGRTLAREGSLAAARVRPLAWGLTAALVGTLVANAFYLTMQMYYFFAFMLLVVAAPFVFARRTDA
jgi:hypothetical protein